MSRYKSVVVLSPLRVHHTGLYACSVSNARGKDTKSYNISIEKRKSSTNNIPRTKYSSSSSSSSIKTISGRPGSKPTTSTTSAPRHVNPAADAPCPLSGYCLNGGTCSFIPWLGELSCSCAPGFQGARCERKTTSALYSSLSLSSTLCLFGLENPYHSC